MDTIRMTNNLRNRTGVLEQSHSKRLHFFDNYCSQLKKLKIEMPRHTNNLTFFEYREKLI